MNQYKLIDCGNFRKLEQFGVVIVDRPAPWAQWPKHCSEEIWLKADAKFIRDSDRQRWIIQKELPLNWQCTIDKTTFQLKPSPSGQIGIFPEQITNWRWIADLCRNNPRPVKILNGFAYTGGSTLAAAFAGAEVTHVDASKSAVKWARENASLSGISSIRWIVDDITTFMEREKKRGQNYDAIILDPPAFGRGKGGKKWQLKKDMPELLNCAAALFSSTPLFFLLTCHDPSFTHVSLKKIISEKMPVKGVFESGELIIPSSQGSELPCGIFVRKLFS